MLTNVALAAPASRVSFGSRRGVFINAAERVAAEGAPLDEAAVAHFEVLDLVRSLRDAAPFRRDGLRSLAPRPTGCGHHLLRGGPQGTRPLRVVGPAQRGGPPRGAGAASRRREVPAAA